MTASRTTGDDEAKALLELTERRILEEAAAVTAAERKARELRAAFEARWAPVLATMRRE
jgi:hypothetical protein